MKKSIFTCVSLGILTWVPAVYGAHVSNDGLKVVNNFNYSGGYVRPAVVISAPVYVQNPAPVDAVPPAMYPRDYYKRPFQRDWYGALKYVHTFASFKSKHYLDGVYCPGGQYCVDKYSFESMMGFTASVGRWYTKHWRIELEGGYTGEHSDAADDIEFAISAPYLTFNALYNTPEQRWGGFYVGPGLGIAFPMTRITGPSTFLTGQETKRQFSPIAALHFGYQLPLGDRFALDIGYKFSTFMGTNHTRQVEDAYDPSTTYDFTRKTGWVMNNSVSIGLRYYF